MPRILVVEPDTALASIAAQYLTKHGHEVTTCPSAQAAISAADSAPPDMVILELAMTTDNGIAFLQEFRSYTDWLEIPIIIYSHIPRDDIELSAADWRKRGVVSYLYKSTATLASLNDSIQANLSNHETS